MNQHLKRLLNRMRKTPESRHIRGLMCKRKAGKICYCGTGLLFDDYIRHSGDTDAVWSKWTSDNRRDLVHNLNYRKIWEFYGVQNLTDMNIITWNDSYRLSFREIANRIKRNSTLTLEG